MFSRLSFLKSFPSRFPDLRSLRVKVLGGVGLVATTFGVLLVFATVQLDSRRCAEVARTHAATLAQTTGLWLDGDAHAGLGQAPEKRLADLSATLTTLLEASDYAGVVRTLRPRPEVKSALAAQPARPHANALQVVLRAGKSEDARADVDYLPEMEDALFEGRTASVLADGRVLAFAPVPDSWGATTAIVCVSGPATAPLWRRIVFWLGASLFAGLLVSFALLLARRLADTLAAHLGLLDTLVRELSAGQGPASVALARGAPSEFTRLAESLEDLRARLVAQEGGQPPPQAMNAPSPENPGAHDALGEASEFDLPLLVQQLVEPARQQARLRGLDVQLIFPEALPSQVFGHPVPLYRALESLLRNALRTTTQGRISLRVSRVATGAEDTLRFEVADTGGGIGFKEQQGLVAALAEAAERHPDTLKNPLQVASALAHAMGGGLSFESQPGQGSRFGFTASFQGLGPAPTTGFHPQATTGFHPAATGFHPGALPASVPPATTFVPRRPLRSR